MTLIHFVKLTIVILMCIWIVSCRQKTVKTFGHKELLSESAIPKTILSDQLSALRSANAALDAKRAFDSGDVRFIGNRAAFPVFYGITNQSTAGLHADRFGYKIIVCAHLLAASENGKAAKERYEVQYNTALYALIYDSKPKL